MAAADLRLYDYDDYEGGPDLDDNRPCSALVSGR